MKSLSDRTINFWINKIREEWGMELEDLQKLNSNDFRLTFIRYCADINRCLCKTYCLNLFRVEYKDKVFDRVGCDCIAFFNDELYKLAKEIVKNTKFCQCHRQLDPTNIIENRLQICATCLWNKYSNDIPHWHTYCKLNKIDTKKLGFNIHKKIYLDSEANSLFQWQCIYDIDGKKFIKSFIR